MNLIEEYVQNLPDSTKIEILEGYETLHQTGMIGEAPIRQHAEVVMNFLDASSVVSWMNQLAFECARYFAQKYIKTLEK